MLKGKFLKPLKYVDKDIFCIIKNEIKRQNEQINLIASENYVSQAVLEATGSVLTNKYAEGYPHLRWYKGCQNVDGIESIAVERACALFGCEHANVQPHSGSSANMAVYFAMLKPGDTVLAMDISSGGHLTHGHPLNFSKKFFNFIGYTVDKDNERLDYDKILEIAKEGKPKMIVAGASAYSRVIDFKKFRSICDAVGAFLLVDMAHIAGLVAADVHPSPVRYAEFITATTHKTLRGPRGGFILCRKEFAKNIDQEVFPGIQGGPLMHTIAAKAVCFKEAMNEEFKRYQLDVIKNAKEIANALGELQYRIVSGGTDNHMFLVDLSDKDMTGKDAAQYLDSCRIVVNKNQIPFDKHPPILTSGIRIGAASVTTRGMRLKEMGLLANMIDKCLKNPNSKKIRESITAEIEVLTQRFPLYNR
jgi:glycine hydroxymethyltransferase